MNKIYKVIWNSVRQCYVVVSEKVNNHGKNKLRSINLGVTNFRDGMVRRLLVLIGG